MLPYIKLFCKDQLDALMQQYPMDFDRAEPCPGSEQRILERLAKAGQYTDDWGCVWHVGEPGVIGEVKVYPLADWPALDKFQPPWHLIRNRDFCYVNKQCDRSDKFMLSDYTARPFERLQFLRGTENTYIDIAYGTAKLRKLLEMIHEFYLENIKSWCESNVDGVFFMDDWGSNDALLINPAAWREIFKPLYKQYYHIIHDAGKFAFFHTDGHTEAIYNDLVEIGIDAINSQLFLMNIEELARKYKGKITFWGEIDRQHILPFGKAKEVREAVMRLRRAFDNPAGGVIAQCEWGKYDPRENIKSVYESWLEPMD